jgi:hypothetical protein
MIKNLIQRTIFDKNKADWESLVRMYWQHNVLIKNKKGKMIIFIFIELIFSLIESWLGEVGWSEKKEIRSHFTL